MKHRENYIMVCLLTLLCIVVSMRYGFTKAEDKYVPQIDELRASNNTYRAEVIRLTNSLKQATEKTIAPAVSADAEAIAKVLYGVRDNSENDLKTLSWCILNRVDSDIYPNTIKEVVEQPSQWMGYSEDNPIIDELYNIALNTIEYWEGGHRPCDTSFIFMDWSPSRILLRNSFEIKGNTQYWSVG